MAGHYTFTKLMCEHGDEAIVTKVKTIKECVVYTLTFPDGYVHEMSTYRYGDVKVYQNVTDEKPIVGSRAFLVELGGFACALLVGN